MMASTREGDEECAASAAALLETSRSAAPVGYVLAWGGVLVDYWTQWTGNYNVLVQVGWIVTVPALLLTVVGSTVLASPCWCVVRRFGCQLSCSRW